MPEFLMDQMSELYINVEHEPVDISVHEPGNTGIPYVWSYESGRPGPHVMVCGIMHGNEIAGAAILDKMLSSGVRPSAGRLTYCFGNPEAYENFDAGRPYLNRFVETDINRVWGAELSDSDNGASEVRRARALQPLVDSVDYLLDIHTMQGRGLPVALTHGKPAALELIAAMTSIPFVLTGTMHQAERLRLRDYAQFGDPDHHAVAVQIEAGQHWERDAVDQGMAIAMEFLEVTGILPRQHRTADVPQKQLKIIKIILPEGGLFKYARDVLNGEFFPRKGALLGFAGPDRTEVRTPVDDCYFIMPVHFRTDGGSSGRFAVEISQ